MHPILAQRERLGLYLAAWTPIAFLIAGFLVFSGGLNWLEAALVAVPMTAVFAFLSLAAWYLCRAFPVARTGPLRLTAVLTAAALVSSGSWIFLGRSWTLALSLVPSFANLANKFQAQLPAVFVIGVLVFFLAVAAHYLLAVLEEARESERRALETQILAREAELRALRAQIDPHFLFNSLNSISALTTLDASKARAMCQRLGDFLRKSLHFGACESITLQEELSLVSDFLSIESVRLGPRLSIALEPATDCGTCRIPPLLLQPLVENAIHHGIAHLVEGGEVRISVSRKGSEVRVRVENPTDPDRPAGKAGGIGLGNVRNRLTAFFGPDARFSAVRRDQSFEVELSFPATLSSS